jgi:hypothetical protein
MQYCWLEVSLHPEGIATDQDDESFAWFTLVPEKNADLLPKLDFALYELYCMHCMYTNGNIKNFALMYSS